MARLPDRSSRALRRTRSGQISSGQTRPFPTAAAVDVTIEKLGSEGLGVARLDGAPILVADTLPGEQVRVLPAKPPAPSTLLQRLTQSPDRISPPCPHFSSCGGCALQHLSEPLYRDFKRGLIAAALRREKLDGIEVAPVIVSLPHSRRRATLAILRRSSGVIIGFRAKASHDIAAIDTCVVLAPVLEALFEPLRALMMTILKPGEQAQAKLTALDNGADLGLVLPHAPDFAQLESLLGFANNNDLARLWWQDKNNPPQPLAERRTPIIAFSGIVVHPPMGGFLQATRDGATALIDAVIESAGTSTRILDLYAGIGTFALPLCSRGKAVHAVEGNADAVSALAAAARQARLRLTTEKRDLDLRPLRQDELEAFEIVIFDPPRAGAKAQVQVMRDARVRKIIAVSCNPATFARDAAILTSAGWRLDRVQPIDQFLWSPHIELVATFQRR